MGNTKRSDGEFLLEFVKYYKKLPALWNKKIQAYYNANTKHKSYMLLLKKYRERYPKATVVDLKKRICMMRSNCRRYYVKGHVNPSESKHYLKELYTVIESQDDSFKEDVAGSSAIDIETTYLDLKCDYMDSEMDASDACNDQDASSASETESETDQVTVKSETPKKQSTPGLLHVNMSTETPTITNVRSLSADASMKNWWKWMATEFNKLHPGQQIIAKRAINDVLLVARQGLLTKESVQINNVVSSVQDTSCKIKYKRK